MDKQKGWELEDKLYSLIHNDKKCLDDKCNWDKVKSFIFQKFISKEEIRRLEKENTDFKFRTFDYKGFASDLLELIKEKHG
ncbi:MAG: hypothetical protein UT24_C0029G0002 [Candidatus Woesebacteria bacterium GW2011_GWB1_39_12]|uniref:Uncharacterized protein n=1 Tax=Candidatus Woesebacteria bacterium GW2011_GWB1_39_12 TaxID=1618574 RepID=A0A0G0MF69_9BACT|nr:MAG: hypothetical protein UT24_C0029G0002 [Candidatus Woesebacteria bacterium GW2011_GWB1_39_12]